MRITKFFVKVVGVCISLFPISLAGLLKNQITMAGFPDVHLTELDKVSKIPYGILVYVSLLFGGFIFYKSIKATEKKQLTRLGFYVLVFGIFFLAYYFGWYYYFTEIKKLNYGQGG
jgi:hypothetical protein